MPEFVDGPTWC